MAVVIKNTFLELASVAESRDTDRRSRSVPRQWKPISPATACSCLSTDSSTHASPRSDLSFFSAMESSEPHSATDGTEYLLAFPTLLQQLTTRQKSIDLDTGIADLFDWDEAPTLMHLSCPTPTSSASSPRNLFLHCESSIEACDATRACGTYWNCPTPMSSVCSPRDLGTSAGSDQCFCEASGFGGSEMDRILCYMKSCSCAMGSLSADSVREEQKALDEEDLACMDRVCGECLVNPFDIRTKLKSTAPSFQSLAKSDPPLPKSDSRTDAIANAIHLALSTSGHAQSITVQMNPTHKPHVMILAEVPTGSHSVLHCYDLIQLAKQSVEAIADRLPTLVLLSARVHKEEGAYTLRSSIAGICDGYRQRMCWDILNRGHCPRRSQCRWHHPDEDDTFRIKVSIRCKQDQSGMLSSHELAGNSKAPKKLTISLGDLI